MSNPPIAALTIEQTPNTCLRPNDRTDERTKAKYRRELRDAAFLAMHQAIVRRPTLPQDARDGRLRLRMHVVWERGRQRQDGDGLLASLKGAIDGIAKAIGRNDRDFVFAPVEQSFTEDRQGVVIVVIEREDAA